MNLLVIIIGGGLSVYAVVTMLHDTDGPFDIFLKFRISIGMDLEVYGSGTYIHDDSPIGFWAKLFSCKYCLSVWVVFLLWLGYIFTRSDMIWIGLAPLGLAYLLINHD